MFVKIKYKAIMKTVTKILNVSHSDECELCGRTNLLVTYDVELSDGQIISVGSGCAKKSGNVDAPEKIKGLKSLHKQFKKQAVTFANMKAHKTLEPDKWDNMYRGALFFYINDAKAFMRGFPSVKEMKDANAHGFERHCKEWLEIKLNRKQL